MNSNLTIAVVSDLHCKYSDGKDISELFSYLPSDLMKFPIERNPVESLKKIIFNNTLKADLLLCPGDITDKCDKQGLISGWKYLEDLKVAFDSKILAATVGNHDVDSRNPNGKPWDPLKNFTDQFPTDNSTLNTHFWAHYYCIVESDKCDLLIFNSSYSQNDEKTCHQSEITQPTLDKIRADLTNLRNNGKIKLAMCHHHPIKHSNMTYKDGDSINMGDDLIKLLESFNFAIIIHGHKHDPRLNYILNRLPIFAAGSFSSVMNLLDLGAQNTFHFIEIEKDNKGKIKTWVYSPKDGWMQKADTYFPCLTGFGVNVNIQKLASDCSTWINSQIGAFVRFDKLQAQFPEIDYLIPSEQIKLNEIMLEEYSIEFMPELKNTPKGITKMY